MTTLYFNAFFASNFKLGSKLVKSCSSQFFFVYQPQITCKNLPTLYIVSFPFGLLLDIFKYYPVNDITQLLFCIIV